MPNPTLQEVVESSETWVHPGRYAYLKCDEAPVGDHFLVCRDADEVTVITEESKIATVKHSESNEWFKLIEFRVTMPFVTKGFLAKIANAVASKDLNIMLFATYSKDYALVREETADVAIEALREAGFPVTVL
ncbi:ACT domain-containing protein [Aeoliella sp.]|uniref:ACT domain-containing protein n=1 Tax=Aeoliella sp. TaxID=2795800 RepID=UPI003CCC3F24